MSFYFFAIYRYKDPLSKGFTFVYFNKKARHYRKAWDKFVKDKLKKDTETINKLP